MTTRSPVNRPRRTTRAAAPTPAGGNGGAAAAALNASGAGLDAAELLNAMAAMPIGLFLCFTPVVIAWVLAAMKQPSDQGDKRR